MRIAIPLAQGRLTAHFGRCESFALLDVDPATRRTLSREEVKAPPHAPDVLPVWLAERGAQVVIAGGMGQRAQRLFAEQGIEVLVGAPAAAPDSLVDDYLAGRLQAQANPCDH
jgi:ATP-binding protein involved in chromosome partitioning